MIRHHAAGLEYYQPSGEVQGLSLHVNRAVATGKFGAYYVPSEVGFVSVMASVGDGADYRDCRIHFTAEQATELRNQLTAALRRARKESK